MIKRFFFFISALVFLCGSTSSGMTSDSFTTHTQHTPIELKPAFLDSDNSFQTAAVCFLGSGVGCGQTCTASPSCTELGYTKTQSECGEDGIKCPFGNLWSCKCKPKCDEIKRISGKTCIMNSYDDGCGGECQRCVYGVFNPENKTSISALPRCSGYFEIKKITMHCELGGWCKSSPDIGSDYRPTYDSYVDILDENKTLRCKCEDGDYGPCTFMDEGDCFTAEIKNRIRILQEQCEATGSF